MEYRAFALARYNAVGRFGRISEVASRVAGQRSGEGNSGALEAFERCLHGFAIQKVLVDGGDTGESFSQAIQENLGAVVEVIKRSELYTFVVLPKQLIVARSFAWLDTCKRLWKNCAQKPDE